MPSSRLDGKHGRTTSGVVCHHCLKAAQAVRRRQALHAIIAFNQQTQSNDFGRGMTSSPLGSTQDRMMLGVSCHHRLWQHTQSDNVGGGMTSPPMDNTHGQQRRQAWHAMIAFGQYRQLNRVGRGMPSSHLDDKHGRMTSGVACHICLWAAQAVRRRQALHAIIAFGQHAPSNDVGRGMTSSPLGSTQE